MAEKRNEKKLGGRQLWKENAAIRVILAIAIILYQGCQIFLVIFNYVKWEKYTKLATK
jgi:hypothetical protein